MQKKIYDSTEFITEPILHRTLFTSNSPVLISYTAVLISHSTLFILQIVSLWYWKDTKCFSNQIKNSPRIKLFSALVYNSGYNSEFTKFCEWRINAARLRNIDAYEYVSRKQLEVKSTTPSASIPTRIPKSRSRLPIRFPPIPIPKPTRILESLTIDVDELEKMEMAKTRTIPKKTWYQ